MGLQELADETVVGLAHRVRRRDLSPVELMDATIAAIEADNPRRNAFERLRPWRDAYRAARPG